MTNIIAIVGRPNVGKSTFFNRLVEQRDAIVHEFSGVTRDRHYGKAHWAGYEFSVIDTGGYIVGSDDTFETEIRNQVILAIEEADVIIFMVNVDEGLTPMDKEIADILRKIKKKSYLVANKVDYHYKAAFSSEFYSLGLGEVFCISSSNGLGTGDLLDEVVSNFITKGEEEISDIPKISIVGKPNVGKSSLVNTLLGKVQNIVTPISGTTRDSIDTNYNFFGFNFTLIDTAGVRKKSKVSENIEFYSVMRSIRTIEKSDVCILMIDAIEGIGIQDINIFGLIQRNNKGVVILVNKWDLIEKNTHTVKQFEKEIKERIAPFTDVTIIFTSVTEKQRIHKAVETAIEVYKNRTKKITTSSLNEVLLPIIKNYPPPAVKGKYIKIKYITQLPIAYPCFAFFANFPQYVKEPYRRFLENKIRENWNFLGVPVKIFLRSK